MRAFAALACACLLGMVDSAAGQSTLTPTPPPALTPSSPPAPLTPSAPPPSPLTPSTPPAPSTPSNAGRAPPAVATLSTFAVGNWSAGAYSVGGKFDHCAGAVRYNSGVALAFYITNTFQWSLGLVDPSWNLSRGTKYPVAFTIDGATPDFGTAVVTATNEVQIPLAPTVALFNRFMQGNLLKVEAATQVFSFQLTATSQLLPGLFKCVESYVGTAPASSNPFVASRN